MRTARVLGPLVLASLLPALARGDEPLRWALGDGVAVHYGLTLDGAPQTVEVGTLPAIPLRLLVGQSDLREGRLPARAVLDPGDLVWHYALALPAGPCTTEPRTEPVDDAFSLGGGRGLRVEGEHSFRRRGQRATLRTTLRITPTGAEQTWFRGGSLLIERVWDVRGGRLEQAVVAIDLQRFHEGQAYAYRRTARIEAEADVALASRDLPERVRRAIERGRGWLRRALGTRLDQYQGNPPAPDGTALGYVALPCFALLRSGVAPEDLRDAFGWMSRQPLRHVYSVALYANAVEARSVQRVEVPARDGARSVVRFVRGEVAPADRAELSLATRWLVHARHHGGGWWGYCGPRVEHRPDVTMPLTSGPLGHDDAPGRGDHSCTQFAVLALHSALASGVDVPAEVWEEIDAGLRARQQETGPEVTLETLEYAAHSPLAFDVRDQASGGTAERGGGAPTAAGLPPAERVRGRARGWGYAAERADASQAYGSMTAAGVSSLAVAREGLAAANRLTPEREVAIQRALLDGLAWLVQRFDRARNPLHGDRWYYYYAYSVEKAMDTAGVERLGPHDWWRDLSAELCLRQRQDGSWEGSLEETAFALLVLNRATLPAGLEVGRVERTATGQEDASAWDRVVVEGVGALRVRQALQSLADAIPSEARERLELSERALAALDPEVRPRVLPELRALLGSSDRGVRRFAERACREVAGTLEPAELDRFAARWEALRQAEEAHDLSRIPDARAALVDASATLPLRRRALATVARLRATEAIGDLVALLAERDAAFRGEVWRTLLSMAGARAPFQPDGPEAERRRQQAAWQRWWEAEGPLLVAQEQARRAVADLAVPARVADAERRLRAIGLPAARALVDGLRDERTRARAHLLLCEVTGQSFPPDVGPWLTWLESRPESGQPR